MMTAPGRVSPLMTGETIVLTRHGPTVTMIILVVLVIRVVARIVPVLSPVVPCLSPLQRVV